MSESGTDIDISHTTASEVALTSTHGLIQTNSKLDVGSEMSKDDHLSIFERLLPVWIILASALGLALGQVSAVVTAIESTTTSNGTNILVAVGLMLMMYPPLGSIWP
jgi:hypothetical protein